MACMSPLSVGASVTWPAVPCAVKVLVKNVSPPRTARLKLPSSPPRPPMGPSVVIARLRVMLTIAEASARTLSPASRWAIASECAGRYWISNFIAAPSKRGWGAGSGGQERREPADQRLQVAGLDVDRAAPLELADETLAREQKRFGSADAAHAKIEGTIEGHDVTRVDHELAVHGHLGDAAVAVDE